MFDYFRYREKLNKLAEHARLLKTLAILLLVLVLLGLSAGLFVLLSRGVFVEKVSCADTVYGDAVKPSANALFSDVSYEFAPAGTDEWSEAAPLTVGRYDVRASAKASFGKTRVSFSSFSIIARPLSLGAAVYGEEIAAPENLVDGDRVLLDYAKIAIDGNGVPSLAVKDGVRIVSKDGSERTDCYDLGLPDGKLLLTKRRITIKTPDLIASIVDIPLKSDDTFTLSSGSLAEGDVLSVSLPSSLDRIGSIENAVGSVGILNQNGKNVTDCYEITVEAGMLTVVKELLTIKIDDVEKVYDGRPADVPGYQIVSGNIADGDELRIDVAVPTLILPGTEEISAVGAVFRNGAAVEGEYGFKIENGLVRIKAHELTIETGSAEKVYDGKPLKCEKHTITDGELPKGHKIEAKFTSLTKPGSIPNSAVFRILNENGEDVTGAFRIDTEFGTLTVFPIEETYLNRFPSDPPEYFVFNVESDLTVGLHLRECSYGDYDGYSQFGTAPAYKGGKALIPELMAASALRNTSGAFNVRIFEDFQNTGITQRLLPYFTVSLPNGTMATEGQIVTSDPNGTTFRVIAETTGVLDGKLSVDPSLSDAEKAYRDFVYDSYLSVPTSTKKSLLKLTDKAGIFPNSPTLITDVATYIRNAATYKLHYQSIPGNVDSVVYFLTVSKEGVCQHFAAAATLMYRSLGIPARYVTGYAVNAKRNVTVNVKASSAHAWTEIYLDGIGWVPVEVTGSSEEETGSGGGFGGAGGLEGRKQKEKEPESPDDPAPIIPPKPQAIQIVMKSASKVFDGKPLRCDEYVCYGTLREGDELLVEATGEQTFVGSTPNGCKYRIIDKDGRDVTDTYKVYLSEGLIKVVAASLLQPGPFSFDERMSFPLDGIKWFNTDYPCEPDEIIFGDGIGVKDGVPYGLLPGNTSITVVSKGLDLNGDNLDDIYRGEAVIPVTVTEFRNVVVANDDEPFVPLPDNRNVTTDFLGQEYVLLQIVTGSVQKEYDGLPAPDFDYEVYGQLDPGHRLVVSQVPTLTYAGKIPAAFGRILVVDENDRDVTSRYVITIYQRGGIEISPVKKLCLTVDLFSKTDLSKIEGLKDASSRNSDGAVIEGGILKAYKKGVFRLKISNYETDFNGDGIPEYADNLRIEVTVRVPIRIRFLTLAAGLSVFAAVLSLTLGVVKRIKKKK